MKRSAGVGIVIAVVIGLGPVLSSPAAAAPAAGNPLATARQRAAALRAQVDRLTVAAEVATEDYDGAQARLADLLTQHLLAQRQLAAAQSTSAGDHRVADDRVRALYINGGPAGLMASVLGAHDLGEAVDRLHTVQGLVGDDRNRVDEGLAAAGEAVTIEARLEALSQQQQALEKQAADAAERVRVALQASQQLLAGADADVVRIAAQERQAAQAAAARAFATRLATAQRAAAGLAGGAGLDPSGPASGGNAVGTNPAPTNPVGTNAVAAARTRLGDPYVWGATGPDSFDCSGLTGWAYRQAGVALPRTSRQQWSAGPHVALADLGPGDLLFWASDPAQPATIHHVAIYLGQGLMIAAPQPGDVVKVQAVYLTGYVGAVRPRR